MSNRWMVILVCCCCLAVPAGASGAVDTRIARLDQIIDRIQKAILHATEMKKAGKLHPGHPYVVQITPKDKLSFSAERFDADLQTAFGVHDKLVRYRHKLAGHHKAAGHQKHHNAAAHRKASHRSRATPPPVPSDDPIAAMRYAEKQTAAASPQNKGHVAVNYDVYQDYRKAHANKLLQQDKAAEADMAAVLAERRQAENELIQMRQRRQQLQAQATKWQAELDKQASQSAKAAAQWEQEHSFGAYATRFLGTVLQTAIGSFSTAFLTPVATSLANRAVSSLFPSVNTANLAARAATTSATRVAVTNLGSAAGQAVANSVTNPGTGTANTQGLQAPAY